MYRDRPPPRGYPPPFEGRGPPPQRPYPAPGFRDDRTRPRPPYHTGYHEHGPPDSYRRSPPRRRYPSPGSGGHRGGEYRTGGPSIERSLSPRGPPPLDHNLVITVGNELTGPRHHDRDYPPRPDGDRSRPRSRSRDRSPDRSRAKSRGRSKSRHRSQSRSPDRSRAKSRGRSKSRHRSQSPSPDRSRAKSRGRSKSRPRSRSRSRSRGRSCGRSYGRSKSRQRSHSRSASSSSSSSSSRSGDGKDSKGLKELETARRRKEMEELLSLPTKSILKKRNNSEDSPSVRSSDSPRGLEAAHMSRVAEQLLQAVRGTEPRLVASMLAELRSDPQMARRAGLDAEIKEILNLLGGAQERVADDIDDEEKFLYGDPEEPRPPPAPEPVRHHNLDLYADVTEEALYADYPPQSAVIGQMYGRPPVVSPHLQAPPAVGEVDLRYASQPTISQDQNIKVQVPNPACPPGTEPLEESERQALEEYEKIQDLLKTIGLDLGVTEISKMAARTKERLHGNKPPPKTPTRCRRYSDGSSDGSRRGCRGRSHSGSSSGSSSSRSRSGRGRGREGWSSEDEDDCRKSSAGPKPHKDRDVKEMKGEPSDGAEPPQAPPNLSAPPPHSGMPIPTYPPPQVHSMMPPNFPPPGFGQFGNYLPYMHQQWPPMHPPPNMSLPPHAADEFLPTLPYKQPYNKAAPELGVKGSAKTSALDGEKGSKVSGHDRRLSEEQNNESQKQKVLEEREKLKQDREVRMKKKEYLMKELERLRKQQGELLRRKRREKDGHKDPLLQEISHLQEDVMTQISNLRKEHEAAEKKRSEIDKVALILGLSPSDRPRRSSKPAAVQEEEMPPQKKKREVERSPDGRPSASSSTIQTSVAPPLSRATPDKPPVAAPAPPPALTPPPEPFEYYDAGNHWCKNCNVTSGSMFDFFTHLHSKTHRKVCSCFLVSVLKDVFKIHLLKKFDFHTWTARSVFALLRLILVSSAQTLDPYDRPWASTPTKISKNLPSEEKLTKPAKGSEFLLPVRGFFCLLCREFYGDAICAEEHVTKHAHNEKYKKQMYENPLYEQRRNLDRQAGLASETGGKKRKHDDNEKSGKDKEEKSKHKKEKKDKEKKNEEDDAGLKEEKPKVKREEEEEKPKPSRKEEDLKTSKSQEEERLSYSKKDEDEKHKYSKKDDKYRHSREEEERGDRYRYGRDEEYRYRYRRDEDDRFDERSKYGSRDDDSKYKSGKHSDFRSKLNRERDEGKPKAENEAFKVPEPDKPAPKGEVSKPEPLAKPYDPPKIFCGPSPAMRAKLRKQSLEAGKPAPAAAIASFGKFTWKKKENILAKEAAKVAAEFIKEDEAAAKEQLVSVEDSFAKSMAAAKEISEKLTGQKKIPPPWVSNGAGRGRIRPNLPAPAAALRTATVTGKPASLNTFLSIRTQTTSLQGTPPADPLLPESQNAGPRPFEVMNVPAKSRPQPFGAQPPPLVSGAALSEGKPFPPVSVPAPFFGKPPPPVSGPAPFHSIPPPPVVGPASFYGIPPPPVVGPAPFDSKPPPPASGLAPFVVQPAPPVSKPVPVQSKPTSAEAKLLPSQANIAPPAPPGATATQPTIIKIVSDVAAPGVPESEQTRTVFVKPPPFMNKGEGTQKSEKLKSTLAAAKAQDLIGIFYSSISHSGSSSFTKPATDTSADRSSTSKSPFPAPLVPKPQPKPHPLTQSQPPTTVHTQPDANNCPPSPQTQTQSDIQITSVWSMQPTAAPTPVEAPPKTASQTPQPESALPAQSKAPSEAQNPSSIPKPESQTTPETEPAELEPTPQTESLPKAAPQIQKETQSEPQPDRDPRCHSGTYLNTVPQPEPQPDQETQSYSETHLDTAPEPELKPGPKTRGKRTPAPRPTRQTRSQTRYQTRRQQQQSQSESEPEPVSGDNDHAASDSKGLEPSDRGSGSQPEGGSASEEDPPMPEITPETLGLPSDMTSLDFDYDFNFE
ncbi:zinc finger protein 318 isoform X2 [Brachyistius frenatus]|uniref:zinc finger protein 318 isoform X2 n=1 Tax=Brachyistius frenatus TaxID=100188 RepID=UPI0037E92E6F